MMKKINFNFFTFLIIGLLLATGAAFVRYIILGKFNIITDEEQVTESISGQINETLNRGL